MARTAPCSMRFLASSLSRKSTSGRLPLYVLALESPAKPAGSNASTKPWVSAQQLRLSVVEMTSYGDFLRWNRENGRVLISSKGAF